MLVRCALPADRQRQAGLFHRASRLASLTVLIAVTAAMESLLGIEAGSKSVDASYRAARLAGMLPMLWLATVVVAPVSEELLFRGFLHRGWAPSWFGVCRVRLTRRTAAG